MPNYSAKNKKKLVFSALFDVRPITADGVLDISKIKSTKRILDLRGLKTEQDDILRQKALKLELIEQPIDPAQELSAADRIILDRLEADLGASDLVQKISLAQKYPKIVSPKVSQLQEFQAKNIQLTGKITARVNSKPIKAKIKTRIKEPEKKEIEISEKELIALDREFGGGSAIQRPILVNKTKEPVAVEPDLFEPVRIEPERTEETQTPDLEINSYGSSDSIRKPTLVSNSRYCEKQLPTKEEILADLEKIDNLDTFSKEDPKTILTDTSLSFNRRQKTKSNNFSDLERLYLQEENIALNNYYSKKKNKDVDYTDDSDIEDVNFMPLQVQTAAHSNFFWPRSLTSFVVMGILVALIIPGATLLGRGMLIKKEVVSSGMAAISNLMAAKKSIEETNWQVAERNFGLASQNFIQAHREIGQLGEIVLGIIDHLPGGSLVSSGSHLVRVGEKLADAGQNLSAAAGLFSFNDWLGMLNLPAKSIDSNNLTTKSKTNSFTNLLDSSQKNLNVSLEDIQLANKELKEVNIDSLPSEVKEGVASLKEKLPVVEELLKSAVLYSKVLSSILGRDNPRQYLLIFQNNSEMRATGGFIGTYGLLKLYQGEIRDLFIDGVFNADGQLREKIVPPRPIQKISTAWSMHDANWFADFPTSAQKISWLYEKTGGSTVDGVISLTPTVVEKLLNIIGPIEMHEYNVVLTADNFVELVQYKVEVDYDKELNQPKMILADFAPKFIEKLSQLSSEKQKEAIQIIINSLSEKHILIYFKDDKLNDFIRGEGWAGQILETDKDYFSVVSSNINGFKTDRVIKETINHQAEINEDGSIIDTITITRKHDGGNLKYDWWNRVNANYLRVYVPLGSELISAEGQSLESYSPPIDYLKNNFKEDALISAIEKNMIVDKQSGTQISTENDKTVFGNWVYVSPGETVTVTYKYKLPFKIDLTKSADSYSLVAQKQSGSLGSILNHRLIYPSDWNVHWQYPEELKIKSGTVDYIGDLIKDKFLGVTFSF